MRLNTISAKYQLYIFLLISLAFQFSCQEEKAINILFIMDDQHRGDCIGAAGAEWMTTPNLDQLASEGVLFKKAYTSVPSCLAARTALLTGKSPWGHGILGYSNPLEKYQFEMPRMFTNQGYRTHAIGKNHFNPMRNTHGYETILLEEGWHSVIKNAPKCDYQIWFEKNSQGLDMNTTGLGYTDHRGGRYSPLPDSLHPTKWTANHAISFIEDFHEDRPWFLKVSFQRPHPPFDPPKKWHEHYATKNVPMPNVGGWADEKYGDKTGSLEKFANATSGNFPEEEIRESRRSYYAGLSFVDEQIGFIIDALKKRGEYENTLILFTADHGDMMGDQYMWRKCRPYEGSVNIPMIIRWPEELNLGFQRGTLRNELVELRDVLPTFLDVVGMPKPPGLDGESMLDILRGKDWRDLLDLEHAQIYEPDNAWTSLTDGTYKYIYYTLTGQEQLFDLSNDPNELVDLTHDENVTELVFEWRNRMIEHLSVRGESWVTKGDLAIQSTSPRFGANDPRSKQQ